LILSNERVYVCGMNKTGKSFWAKRLTANMATVVPVIVYDPNWEHSDLVPPGEEVISSSDQLLHLEPLAKAGVVLVQPDDDSDSAWSDFCRGIWEGQRNVFVVVDEAHDVCPAMHDLDPYHRRLIRRGRHFGIGMAHISQRPAETHKMPLAQANHVVAFKMHLANDLEYLSSWLQSRELPGMIQQLKPYHSIYYDVSEGRIYVNPPIA
jgi:DNA helicase HerA-like ATPase